MNKLTTGEKMALLRYHGEALARAFSGIQSPYRGDLIERAERALAIIKSIPRIEFALEDKS